MISTFNIRPIVSWVKAASNLSTLSIVAAVCFCQVLFAAAVFALLHTKKATAPDVSQEEPRPLAPIRIPRHKKRIQDYLADGQPIRHKTREGESFFGTFDAERNRIRCEDGRLLKTLSGFVVHHIQTLNPNRGQVTADGWSRCEVQIEDGSWVKANTLTLDL